MILISIEFGREMSFDFFPWTSSWAVNSQIKYNCNSIKLRNKTVKHVLLKNGASRLRGF